MIASIRPGTCCAARTKSSSSKKSVRPASPRQKYSQLSPPHMTELNVAGSASNAVTASDPCDVSVPKRRRVHTRLSSTTRKRQSDWGSRTPTVYDLSYRLYPHVPICVGQIAFNALLDIRSERFFVDADRASISRRGEVYLADEHADSRSCNHPYRTIIGRDVTHEFQVRPTLDVEILVGVEL